MYELYEEERRTLIRLSAIVVLAGAAILPFTLPPSTAAASASPAYTTKASPVTDVPARLRYPAVFVQRDPFVPDADSTVSSTSASGGETGLPDLALPPNQGADESTSARTVIVRGVVLGQSPEALIEVSGTVRIFGIGDALEGAFIEKIDARGVALTSGGVLKLVSSAK